MRNRPSAHLLLLVLLVALSALAYLAIYRAGITRGFVPSGLLAIRDLALFIPIFFTFIWLVRRHRYVGESEPLHRGRSAFQHRPGDAIPALH